MDIGIKIATLRKKRKLTQPELVFQLGVSQTALCEIESGKTKKIDFKLMAKICEILEVDFEYFTEKSKLKQINKENGIGYMAEVQNFSHHEKIIEQYEIRINELNRHIETLEVAIKNIKK